MDRQVHVDRDTCAVRVRAGHAEGLQVEVGPYQLKVFDEDLSLRSLLNIDLILN